MAVGSEAAKAAHGCGSEARSEPEGRPPATAAGPEPARRYRNPAANSCWQDRERVIERRMVKAAEREPEVEAEPPAFPPTPAAAPVTNAASGYGANGVSDVEALLAKLRAL